MEHDQDIHIRIDRRWLRRLVVLAATVALAVPTAAWAGHEFSDVSSSNTFHADIGWMADKGVTKGCNPPANDRFCPDAFVTREQMAAFMHRLESEGVLVPRFAVIEYGFGAASLKASRGLVSWKRESAGLYLLTFDRDISDCAWTSADGTRNNAINGGSSFNTVALHSAAKGPESIRVQIKDETGTAWDTTFNVGVHC